MVYAYRAAPVNSWDPALEVDTGIVLGQVYETLTRYDASTGDVGPNLATAWSSSADAKTWTFTLRQGVKFHDGTEFNAKAVKFSILRTKKMGVGMAYLWSGLESIDTPDSYTVVMKWKTATPADLIASSCLGAFIYSPTALKEHGDKWFADGHEAGTGAYMLKSQTMGTEAVLERFDGYWGGWEGKHVDDAIVRNVSESAVRTQLIEGGDAQIVFPVSIDDIPSLKATPDVSIVVSPSFTNIAMDFNTKKGPTANRLVREAIQYAFPYDDAITASVGGYGERSTGPTPKGLWGYEEQSALGPPIATDLAKARELLKEAGYPNGGFTLQLLIFSGDDETMQMAQLLKDSLSQLNIDLNLRALPSATLTAMTASKNPPQNMSMFHWWPSYANPNDTYAALFYTQDPPVYNTSYYSNPQVDAMIDQANLLAATDRPAAAKLLAETWKTVSADYPIDFIVDDQSVIAVSNSVHGFEGFNPAYTNEVRFYDCWLK